MTPPAPELYVAALLHVLATADQHLLDQKRKEQTEHLKERNEVIP